MQSFINIIVKESVDLSDARNFSLHAKHNKDNGRKQSAKFTKKKKEKPNGERGGRKKKAPYFRHSLARFCMLLHNMCRC